MNKNSHYAILFSVLLSFVAMIGTLFTMNSFDFVIEVSIIFGLLVAAAVLLYLLFQKYRFLWSYATVYFSINILNAIYLYFVGEQVLVILYALFSFIGLFVSISNINRKEANTRKNKEDKYLGKYADKKVAVASPKTTKTVKRTVKSSPAKAKAKTVTKKTTTKTSAKKARPAKSAKKVKPAKKAAKTTAKKTVTKKTTTAKKAPAKSAVKKKTVKKTTTKKTVSKK